MNDAAPIVFFDANVLYGARLRSLILYLAQTKLFRPRWSERIHDEWMRNVSARTGIATERLIRTRDLMNASVLDSVVVDFEALESSLVLPDPSDCHVLAAAIIAKAEIILTFNTRDFPAVALDACRMEALHPDRFLSDLLARPSQAMADAVKRDFTHYRAPPFTFEQYMEALAKAGVPETARCVEKLRNMIEMNEP